MKKRIYTSKDKKRVLKRARDENWEKISLWKDSYGIWHLAKDPQNVPNWAAEVEHVK